MGQIIPCLTFKIYIEVFNLLEKKILKAIDDRKDDVSVIVKDLNKDKWILKLNEQKVFRSASTIKIPIIVGVLRQVELF